MPSVMIRASKQQRTGAPRIGVDFPKQDEAIGLSGYSLRVSAPKACRAVEVAIDQGAWLPCREAVGFWWYDWSGYEAGEHEASARAQTEDGRRILSAPCQFVASDGRPSGAR